MPQLPAGQACRSNMWGTPRRDTKSCDVMVRGWAPKWPVSWLVRNPTEKFMLTEAQDSRSWQRERKWRDRLGR